jgi:hypothetical protein
MYKTKVLLLKKIFCFLPYLIRIDVPAAVGVLHQQHLPENHVQVKNTTHRRERWKNFILWYLPLMQQFAGEEHLQRRERKPAYRPERRKTFILCTYLEFCHLQVKNTYKIEVRIIMARRLIF